MSTYLYLRCEDHNPPLLATEESTQHAHRDVEMSDVRRWVRDRERLCDMADRGELDWSNYFLANSVRFLSQHRTCRIGIEDEYGREWDLATGELSVLPPAECDCGWGGVHDHD